MKLNFAIITDNFGEYLGGLWLTIQLVGQSLIIGFILSILLALVLHFKVKFFSQIIRGYVYFFRGTPLLLQMYMIYYGSGQFDFIRESFLWIFLREAYICALLAFVLNTAAYTTEILRGALGAMNPKEIEAGKAFGMTKFQIYKNIVIPNVLRRSIPAYSNEVIFMIHASALVSVVTLSDITGVARYFYSKYYDPFTPFIGAAGFYLVLIFLVVWIFRLLEKKFLAFISRDQIKKQGLVAK